MHQNKLTFLNSSCLLLTDAAKFRLRAENRPKTRIIFKRQSLLTHFYTNKLYSKTFSQIEKLFISSDFRRRIDFRSSRGGNGLSINLDGSIKAGATKSAADDFCAFIFSAPSMIIFFSSEVSRRRRKIQRSGSTVVK